MEYVYCTLIGYLIGCFNPSFLLGRIKGVDIKKKGSGNAGASNALILFGKLSGIICALLDILKAYLAIKLTEALFENYLYSAGVPDPELIIRPSGEMRTSNFLLWQSAYSEFVFMDILWPDFSPADLDKAIEEYYRRNRRFGGV